MSSFNVLVFSCVPQPALKIAQNIETILLSASSFCENWHQMLDNLSARGMHRLMVEPGAGLARKLFATEASTARVPNSSPLWNRLDMWQSTDSLVDCSLESKIASGEISCGLEFLNPYRQFCALQFTSMIGGQVQHRKNQ